MSEYGTRTPEENDGPVPRDLPDQQVQEGEDPWDVVTPPESGPSEDSDGAVEAAGGEKAGTGVPDTDEAGTGRQGESSTSTVHPEDPEPEESPA
ncbi:hypothetical protein GCM10010372_71460 [Streptomyces tauricus]|uniref:hypothetical protein n=1 Tax=Streptomyces tauricus TaxID=68274 RepID=UPI0016795526|nr:hypothetical protein [Streptomyces tauricus]MCW8097164.1 hypothetical protein [Streptomyces tauricus]GHA61429.1 hypothetical protein GCM10010372_71460 [Streptomyces tauricus]